MYYDNALGIINSTPDFKTKKHVIIIRFNKVIQRVVHALVTAHLRNLFGRSITKVCSLVYCIWRCEYFNICHLIKENVFI